MGLSNKIGVILHRSSWWIQTLWTSNAQVLHHQTDINLAILGQKRGSLYCNPCNTGRHPIFAKESALLTFANNIISIPIVVAGAASDLGCVLSSQQFSTHCKVKIRTPGQLQYPTPNMAWRSGWWWTTVPNNYKLNWYPKIQSWMKHSLSLKQQLVFMFSKKKN